jgi:hypothetical protein
LTNHVVECPRLTKKRVKDFVVWTIGSNSTRIHSAIPAIVAFAAFLRSWRNLRLAVCPFDTQRSPESYAGGAIIE